MKKPQDSPVVSFTINHDKLFPGVYVSRKDKVGSSTITTFDLRMKKPNSEIVLDNHAIHTLEHLMAVYLRGYSGEWAEKIIYIGPMGCRTGMYLLVNGDLESNDIIVLLKNMFGFIKDFEGEVPAATSVECGNFRDHDLEAAKFEAKQFVDKVLSCIGEKNTVYPI